MKRHLFIVLGLFPGAAGLCAQSERPHTDVLVRKTETTVQHLSAASRLDFDATVKRFDAQLGVFDPASIQGTATASPEELQAIRAKIEKMIGTSGFVRFDRVTDHGSLLPLVGQSAGRAVQYVIGNPLIAVEMTRHNLAAGLYAPLRVILYEDRQGTTHLEYDLPSSLFGQCHDSKIDEVAAGLDRKMAALVEEASGR